MGREVGQIGEFFNVVKGVLILQASIFFVEYTRVTCCNDSKYLVGKVKLMLQLIT
jgi:hypothetical protein